MITTQRTRRDFLRLSLAAGAAGLIHPTLVLGDPYRPVVHRLRRGAPIQIRGRVAAGRRGLAGVAISDGYDVVRTGADGSYELSSSDRQGFVFVSMPPGFEIPVGDTGVASFFHPVAADARGQMSADFNLQPIEGGDSNHAFLALGDTQTQTPYEMGRLHDESIPDIIETLRGLGDTPVFGLACGDIMFDDLSLYPEYERAVRRIDRPFFQVVGNHDLDQDAGADPDSIRTFERHFGPSYYSFNRGEVHYVVLDDVLWHAAGYIGHVGAEQLAWLERDLATVEPGSLVIVFQHIPSLATEFRRNGGTQPGISVSVTNREHVYRLLEPFDAHIISGHTHENEHVFEGGTHEHILGTTCGAWWSDHICYDGTPNGYAIFEVAGSTLKWRYKGTGMGADEQIRVYPRGSEPSAPGEIVANVWDWDPEWQVVWYEGGERRGEMARRIGKDPLAVQLFDGPAKPSHRTWVQPINVGHLFYAPVSEGATDVVVEATDRFGRVYTAR
jgi:hypothetical protein